MATSEQKKAQMTEKVKFLAKVMGFPESGAGSLRPDGANYMYRVEQETPEGGAHPIFGAERFKPNDFIARLDFALLVLSGLKPNTENVEKLQTIYNSCQEAIDGTWDKSDDGFEAMQDQVIQIAASLGGKIDTSYSSAEDEDGD